MEINSQMIEKINKLEEDIRLLKKENDEIKNENITKKLEKEIDSLKKDNVRNINEIIILKEQIFLKDNEITKLKNELYNLKNQFENSINNIKELIKQNNFQNNQYFQGIQCNQDFQSIQSNQDFQNIQNQNNQNEGNAYPFEKQNLFLKEMMSNNHSNFCIGGDSNNNQNNQDFQNNNIKDNPNGFYENKIKRLVLQPINMINNIYFPENPLSNYSGQIITLIVQNDYGYNERISLSDGCPIDKFFDYFLSNKKISWSQRKNMNFFINDTPLKPFDKRTFSKIVSGKEFIIKIYDPQNLIR